MPVSIPGERGPAGPPPLPVWRAIRLCSPDLAGGEAPLRGSRHGRGSWRLVFDNADDPAELRPWLPGGAGHVLITSRTPTWAALATPVDVDLLSADEAVHFLRTRLPDLDPDLAREVAAELDGLPLALEQAAAYLEQTRIPAASTAAPANTAVSAASRSSWLRCATSRAVRRSDSRGYSRGHAAMTSRPYRSPARISAARSALPSAVGSSVSRLG